MRKSKKNPSIRYYEHNGKSGQQKQDYLAFLSRSSFSKNTINFENLLSSSEDEEGLVFDTTKSNESLKGGSKIDGAFKKPKKPYVSWQSTLNKMWKNYKFSIVGSILLIIASICITTIWTLNRDVGVLQEGLANVKNDINNLQDNYKELSNSNKETEFTASFARLNAQFEAIKDRILRLENL